MKTLANKWFIIVLLWLLGLVLIIWLIYIYSDSESIVENIVSAVSAYAVSTTLMLNAYSVFQKIEADKFNLTMQIISKWDDEHFMKARDYTRQQQNIKEKIGNEAILKEIEEKPKLKKSIIMMMDFFETLETFLENNGLDKHIIMEHFAYMIKDILDRYDCYLKSDSFKKNNPLGFRKLSKLKNMCEHYAHQAYKS